MTKTPNSLAAGDPTDSEIIALEAKAAELRAAYRQAANAADANINDVQAGRRSEAAYAAMSAAELAMLAIPANTARGVLAKLWVAAPMLGDLNSHGYRDYAAALRGDLEAVAGNDWLVRFIASATGDLARQIGIDPVPPSMLRPDGTVEEIDTPMSEPAEPAAMVGVSRAARASMLASDLHDGLEELASRIDSLAGAAGTLGCTFGSVGQPGTNEPASLFHAAEFVLENLHRDVDGLLEDARQLRQSVNGGVE